MVTVMWPKLTKGYFSTQSKKCA